MFKCLLFPCACSHVFYEQSQVLVYVNYMLSIILPFCLMVNDVSGKCKDLAPYKVIQTYTVENLYSVSNITKVASKFRAGVLPLSAL